MLLIIYFVLYQLITIMMLPFIVGYLLLRKWRGKTVFGNAAERMGFVPRSPQAKVIWMHAVSVGEVLAIQELIVRLKQQDPQVFVYLTTGTLSGNKIAREQLSADIVSFMPFDFLFPVWYAFCRINPVKLIVVEAELWPNLLMIAWMKRVPCYLLNARILQSSAYRNWLRRVLVLPLLRIFTHIYAQTAQEKKAFESLGLSANNVSELGNIKAFNVLVKQQGFLPQLHGQCNGLSYPTLLVGSLHQPELALYLELFKTLRETFPQIKLILAPRHFHWQAVLKEAVQALGVSFLVVDDQKTSLSQEIISHYDVVLICTIGKLFEVYPLADLFFLGGTFVPVGGHNLLEPAVWARATVVGPFHHNSQVIADELEQVGALIKIIDPKLMTQRVMALLHDRQDLVRRGNAAHQWLIDAAGRVEHNVDAFLRDW